MQGEEGGKSRRRRQLTKREAGGCGNLAVGSAPRAHLQAQTVKQSPPVCVQVREAAMARLAFQEGRGSHQYRASKCMWTGTRGPLRACACRQKVRLNKLGRSRAFEPLRAQYRTRSAASRTCRPASRQMQPWKKPRVPRSRSWLTRGLWITWITWITWLQACRACF